MLKSSILAAFVIAAPMMLPATLQAEESNADTVVATVNGQEITLGQMIVMKQSMQDPQMAELPDQALWDLMLDQLVRQTAVAANGKENAGVRAQLELQRRNTLAAAAVTELSGGDPTDEEIKAAYDELFANAEATTEYSAAHILVKTEDKAKELKKELDGGADFGTLAEENSTGPSGPNKGDLGWFAADQMVPPFAEAVKAMEPGQVSDPVQTDFGWHIIKLNDTRVKEAPKLEEIREQLVQKIRRDKIEAEIERVSSEAKVEKAEGIDPALINNTDLLEAE
ncbi:peptidylprolyl isomerase [Paracoccus alkanivorans]|uniref:Parvulin-like PPIase n=1 Tax=Paracoccus alkanivorans TaxID=2116655 RepID=A0A3M0M968_9RHOB|nr:peptidylprolyl isomerase [Paracoccus alkanivorans]RMC34338.1 peptidylprolyl isomerase [Paracoccus alkanivorans]